MFSPSGIFRFNQAEQTYSKDEVCIVVQHVPVTDSSPQYSTTWSPQSSLQSSVSSTPPSSVESSPKASIKSYVRPSFSSRSRPNRLSRFRDSKLEAPSWIYPRTRSFARLITKKLPKMPKKPMSLDLSNTSLETLDPPRALLSPKSPRSPFRRNRREERAPKDSPMLASMTPLPLSPTFPGRSDTFDRPSLFSSIKAGFKGRRGSDAGSSEGEMMGPKESRDTLSSGEQLSQGNANSRVAAAPTSFDNTPHNDPHALGSQKAKPFFLGRTKSQRRGSDATAQKSGAFNRSFELANSGRPHTQGEISGSRNMHDSESLSSRDNTTTPSQLIPQPQTAAPPVPSPSPSAFLSNLKSTSNRAADGIGKVGKGIFGKLRGHHDAGPTPNEAENYVCKVITRPLVEQTRITRISKRLEESRDKTEFWMPALPWRCIDYLNYKGCEEEGLYRVPGSGPRVKEWQKRFDIELDIDLYKEEDLYDVNIIGSMFKAWLRELPDEIFPKAAQARVAAGSVGASGCPQILKDELSQLPPFNYYLLFAVTCHLSLLHSFAAKNKMDYRNLCICFQPALRIDSHSFQFLVCDWKNCWQGCWTEKQALKDEYLALDGKAPERTILDEEEFPQGPASFEEEPQMSTAAGPEDALHSNEEMNGTHHHQQPGGLAPPPPQRNGPSPPSQHNLTVVPVQGGNSSIPSVRPVSPISPIMPF